MKFLALALAATTAVASPPSKVSTPKRALYFLDSDTQKAKVVSIAIDGDGFLQLPAVSTETGGRGLAGIDMNGTVRADPLFSQDSVVVKENQLFTVNAGSNTLSRFYIPASDPLHPIVVGTASTLGEFPNSVAYSDKHQMACVSNTGRKAGIQCFRVPECEGLEPLDGLLPLNGVNQTTPPTAPGSVSDVVFNPSQTALFVSIKGKGTDRGYLYAYSVDEATHRLNPNPTISRPPGLMIDFSLTFLSDSTAVVTDPAYGASYLSITPDLKVSVSKKITIPGQRATCWSVSSEEFNAVYVLDGASPNVTALDPMSGEISFVIPGNMTSMGSLDAAAAGSRLYVLQASPAVAVFDLAKPGLVQYLNLASLGPRPGWTGMAVYSA